MHTKLIRSIGPHDNPGNLSTIAYCIEPPRKVLEYLLDQGYMVGGYRQADMTRCIGEGIVIRGTDMDPLPFGLKVTAKMTEIPLEKYALVKREYRDDDLEWMFGHNSDIRMLRSFDDDGWRYVSIFSLTEDQLTPEEKLVRDAAREFVEVVKGHSVSLDYLISLSV